MSWRIWRSSSPSPADPGPGDGAIPLGSGQATAAGVPSKAALLDRAAAAGIRVPVGFVVPEGAPAPDTVTWAGRRGARALAVRSAFGAEDRATSSLAGWFETELGVAPADVAAAIGRIRASADRRGGRFRRDVLVMAMVDADTAGVAFSEPGTYDDLVNATAGTAEGLVSGEVAGERRELPRLEPAPDGWPRRLQGLLAEVRTVFGDLAWDIEWADDGEVCWLIQVRPVTAPTLRPETLTAANHAEILPPLPSQLMTSVIEEAGPELFAWYRRRVPGLPASRDFLYVKEGRPMINLSLLEDMMRHLGLPTALVADSIGGGTGRDLPARPLRILRMAPSLIRLGLAQVEAVARARRREAAVATVGSAPAVTVTDALADLRHVYVLLVTGMFPLSSAIGPPLSVLRRAGTLLEHASSHRTVTTELAHRAAELGTGSDKAALASFLQEFGHRGVYESDIARPRYRDDPSVLLTGSGADRSASAPSARTLRGWLTWPVWALAAPPLAARERYRHEAMRGFAAVRTSLVTLAEGHVRRGALRTAADLWLLTAPEARRLDDGWIPDEEFWREREAVRSHLAAIEVPHVVGRDDPPSAWSSVTNEGDVIRGLPLTSGVVSGRAWRLDEPATADVMPPEGEPLVLVARSIDAGWIPTLHRVDAAVVEIGGDLSHGSILMRELGLPAITNAAGACRAIRTGDRVRLDAAAGTVTPADVDEQVGR